MSVCNKDKIHFLFNESLKKKNVVRKQTPDSKKEEFRKYLEKSGVIDSLTKALVGLYEEGERPSNAVDYMKQFMGAPTGIDVEALKAENVQLKEENGELKQAIEELNAKLDALTADAE